MNKHEARQCKCADTMAHGRFGYSLEKGIAESGGAEGKRS